MDHQVDHQVGGLSWGGNKIDVGLKFQEFAVNDFLGKVDGPTFTNFDKATAVFATFSIGDPMQKVNIYICIYIYIYTHI